MEARYPLHNMGSRPKKQTADIGSSLRLEMRRERDRVRRKIIYAMVMLACVYVASIAASHFLEG